MAVDVQVPVGGEGAEEYVLVRWYAAEGERVTKGASLFEIETAKATYDVPAPGDGLLSIAIPEGAEVSAHQVVGTIHGDFANAGEHEPASDSSVGIPSLGDESLSDDPSPGVRPQAAELPATPVARSSRVVASPRARSTALTAGIRLDAANGSGPGGRVLARDVPASPMPSTPLAPVGRERAVIARRMTEAAAIPTVTLHRWADGTGLRDLVARLRAHAELWGLARVSVGDVLAAVVARVLPRHPALNAHWDGDVRRFESVHLGVAVDAPWGLVVPVVRDAHQMSVAELSAKLGDLAARARTRTVRQEEITGSTFTISNLGPTGVEHFTPLLNPPEVAILGVGALVPDRTVPAEPASMRLPLSLTFDHRAVDGAPAGRFLAEIAAGIEAADAVLALGEGMPHVHRILEGGTRQ